MANFTNHYHEKYFVLPETKEKKKEEKAISHLKYNTPTANQYIAFQFINKKFHKNNSPTPTGNTSQPCFVRDLVILPTV